MWESQGVWVRFVSIVFAAFAAGSATIPQPESP